LAPPVRVNVIFTVPEDAASGNVKSMSIVALSVELAAGVARVGASVVLSCAKTTADKKNKINI
jgi:hypothetical protein